MHLHITFTYIHWHIQTNTFPFCFLHGSQTGVVGFCITEAYCLKISAKLPRNNKLTWKSMTARFSDAPVEMIIQANSLINLFVSFPFKYYIYNTSLPPPTHTQGLARRGEPQHCSYHIERHLGAMNTNEWLQNTFGKRKPCITVTEYNTICWLTAAQLEVYILLNGFKRKTSQRRKGKLFKLNSFLLQA